MTVPLCKDSLPTSLCNFVCVCFIVAPQSRAVSPRTTSFSPVMCLSWSVFQGHCVITTSTVILHLLALCRGGVGDGVSELERFAETEGVESFTGSGKSSLTRSSTETLFNAYALLPPASLGKAITLDGCTFEKPDVTFGRTVIGDGRPVKLCTINADF
ncbi:unnamed protein product [Mesocestoides corti]|uniref:MHD domain-containing protein n=1 Tax=Mesocestoides corti TaxID=53468 RepID=A0A0R3U4W9_MESCO|nr:unnamed protein product [Mesocestoides corti]